jgi:hypothetical protein
MMPLYFSVDVLMERIPLVNRWVSESGSPRPCAGWRGRAATERRCALPTAHRDAWRFPASPSNPTTEAEGYSSI